MKFIAFIVCAILVNSGTVSQQPSNDAAFHVYPFATHPIYIETAVVRAIKTTNFRQGENKAASYVKDRDSTSTSSNTKVDERRTRR